MRGQATKKALAGALLTGALLLGHVPSSLAVVIGYTVQHLDEDVWRYDYVVENFGGFGDVIEEFTIYFDPTAYENLESASAPAGWNVVTAQPNPLIPHDGFYDAEATSGGIALDAMLAGFSVQFSYFGEGTPGAQVFEIINPENFQPLETGMTSAVLAPGADPLSVPVPGAFLWLLGVVLATGAVRYQTRRPLWG